MARGKNKTNNKENKQQTAQQDTTITLNRERIENVFVYVIYKKKFSSNFTFMASLFDYL